MQTSSIAKACVIPICNNQKFNLVHKFPADKERFEAWIEAITLKKPIEKLAGLTPDAIRKRFFICSRHFGLQEYKNIESRSLNLTAVPHLNLAALDRISMSKAFQQELNSEAKEELMEVTIIEKPAEVPKPPISVRILNSGAPKPNLAQKCFLPLQPKGVKESQGKSPSLNEVQEPQVKRVKMSSDSLHQADHSTVNPPNEILFNCEKTESSPPATPSVSTNLPSRKEPPPLNTSKKNIKQELNNSDITTIAKLEEAKPANKLLALIEVTPEQYELLNKSLSLAERSENVASLVNFMNENNDEVSTDNEIVLNLEDGSCLKIDLFWLRDHCRCESCYDHSNHQRKFSILDIPDDISIKDYTLKGGKLHVIWNDTHESSYNLKFLLDNQPIDDPTPSKLCLWNNEKLEGPLKTKCSVSMRDYMSDPDVSKKVLESLHVYGVALIDGVQPTQQNTEFVIRQLFPIHKTLFGEMWTFSDAKKDHSDTAYTNLYLGPHNDNTYFNDGAGLQILHCINYAGTGGENFLIDGFQVAEKIKQEQAEVFDRLTKTVVTAEYIEDGRHHKHSAPIISLDSITGEIAQIRFNLYDRAPFKSTSKIRQFYSDLKVLAREFENPENRITFKLQPGTVLIFDNWRVLHGRLAYSGKRTMTGCYVARTEFQSALRVNNLIE